MRYRYFWGIEAVAFTGRYRHFLSMLRRGESRRNGEGPEVRHGVSMKLPQEGEGEGRGGTGRGGGRLRPKQTPWSWRGLKRTVERERSSVDGGV